MSALTRTFDQPGEFASIGACERWLKQRGFSVGSHQRGAPIGILHGDVSIAKWRNLDGEDIENLHGRITSPTLSYREGPVTVSIRPDAPRAVIDAFLSDDGAGLADELAEVEA